VNLCLGDASAAAGHCFERVECVLKDVHNYLSGSPKRRRALMEACEAVGQVFVNVASWGETRWSSRYVLECRRGISYSKHFTFAPCEQACCGRDDYPAPASSDGVL
jgi:hypothetical protein